MKCGVSLVLCLVISSTILVGCKPKISRPFAPIDLIISVSYFPDGWEMSGDKQPSPPGDLVPGSDENDRYTSYKLVNNKYNLARHYVLQFDDADEAADWYIEEFPYYFNSNSMAVDEPWRTPPEATFASSFADQYFLGCTINNVDGRKQVCQFMGQYEEFVTIFSASVRSDTMTLAEFEEIVKGIDVTMMSHLQSVYP